MKLTTKLSVINSIFKIKLFNTNIPIVISWMITKRCNYMCKYCNDQKLTDQEELDTKQIFFIIDKLSKIGTKIISLTGGEPLLREDIGKIVDYCAEQDIFVGINSNGSLVRDKIAELTKLNALNLSLDGPEEVNDSIRGPGSFKAVIEASDIAYSRGIRIKFSAVLSKHNLDFKCIDYLLELAKKFNTTVFFQPAEQKLLRANGINPLTPPEQAYKAAINYLISKKGHNKHIGNSVSGLKHLYSWPNPKKIKCTGMFNRIDNQGNVMVCPRIQRSGKGANFLSTDFKELFMKSDPFYCDSCCCASRIEMNYLFSLKPDVIFNMKQSIWW
ncbi:radical SAM protein [Candidatus Omnitrophota bacterium]